MAGELVPAPASRRVLVTGLSTYWGGQARAGARELRAGRGDHRRRLARAHARARADRVREGLQPALAAAADRPRGRDRHRHRHPHDRQLARSRSPRFAHENNVIGTMNILAACTGARLARAQVRLQELDPLLRRRAGRPRVLHRAHEPPASAAHAARARHRRGRGAVASSPTSTRTSRRPSCAARTSSAPTSRPPFTRMFAAPRRADGPGLRPAASVRPRGRRRPRARARRAPRHVPGTFNVAADGVLALSEAIDLLGKRRAVPILPPVGRGLLAGLAAPARLPDPGRDRRTCCASDAGSTTGCTRRPGSSTASPRARPSQRLPSTCAWRRSCAPARARTAITTSARSRSSCAGARTCAASARAEGVAADREPLGI